VKNLSPIAQEYMETGRSDSCPIIDMHGHFGPYGSFYLPGAPLERMLESLERSGCRRIVCSPHEALMGNPVPGNALMQRVIDAHPDHFLGYCVINPNYPVGAAQAVESFHTLRGFVGFKLLPEYHFHPVTGPAYSWALAYANEHRQLILVHTWGGTTYNSPGQLAEVAARYPDATFIMGHSGYGDWATAVGAARDLPNVYLELTAVYAADNFSLLSFCPEWRFRSSSPGINGVIEHMVEHAGSHKIVFGTDLPWYSPHYAAGSILFAHIDDEDRHNILHRNAERLLGQHLVGVSA
jgi:uncharacterized protein